MSSVVIARARRRGAYQPILVACLSIALLVAGLPSSIFAAGAPAGTTRGAMPGTAPAIPAVIPISSRPALSAAAVGDGLLGRYYPNTTWTGAASLERVDPTIDFDWTFAHPINASDFSVAWSGSLLAQVAGTYTLALTSDDGSTLSLDGAVVVDNSGQHSPRQVANSVVLTAGLHSISVRYFECCSGQAQVQLFWTPPGGTGLVIVPQAVLFSQGGPPNEQTYGIGSRMHGPVVTRKEAEPVDTATGNYVSEATDLTLPGRGLPLAFSRTYNSLDPIAGPLGPGWTDTYSAAVTLNADGSILVRTEDGAQFRFPSDGSGGFVAPAGSTDQLVTIAGGYELRRADQFRYQFSSTGRLVAEIDRNGNTLTFAYSGANLTTITDTVGRVITLGYDASGRRTSLADPTGRTVAYAYNATGRLASVTDVRAGLTAYAYDASGRLATITDPNGHVLVTNTYGPTGRVTDQIDALGQHGTFAWDPASGTSTFTDHRGGVWTDVYAANKLVAHSDPLGNTTTSSYDARFNRTSTTDPRGKTTTFTYDAAGNVLSVTAPPPLGYSTQFTYDATNNVLTATDGRGFTTTKTYDASGNLRTVTGPGPTNPVTTLTVTATGQLASSSDPRGKTTTFTYDAQGNQASATSPLGERTTMAYDGAGRMTSLVEARGNVTGANPADYTTTLTYDPAGHLLSTTDPLGNRTTTTYDPAGNRTSVKDANNRTTGYAYDAANRLVSVSDALAKVTTYTYDATGNLVGRTDPNGHVTGFAYDLAGRMTSTTDPLNQVTATTYDPAGNRATRTDANARTTTYTYDALNRLTGITYAAPTTAPVTYAYDANGNRTGLTDGAGTETFAYDSLNRLTSDTRGADSFTYSFDAAGNRLSRTYPDGTATTYTYDGDGRMASASFPLAAAPTTTSFAPVADAHVKNTNPATNYGAATTLVVKNDPATTVYRAYLRFSVSGLAAPVAGALLRLYSTTTSADAGRRVCVAVVADTTWTETALTWANAPAAGQQLSCLVGTQAAGWVSYDLGAAIGGAGTYSLVLTSTSPDAVTYSSREGANPPQLVLTTASGSLDTAAPSVPAGLAATTVSAAQIDLAWTAASDTVGVSGYRVYRDGAVVATTGGPAYSDVGLETASTHTYTVAALDAAGNVSAQSAGAAATSAGARFAPAADAHVKNTSPATNYGTATTLLVKNDPATTIYRAYLRFTVTGWSGAVGRATLVLRSTTNSAGATRQVCVAPVATTTWGETTITWSTAPAIGTPNLSCVTGDQAVGAVAYDLGSAVTGNGTYSFALTSTSPAAVTYASKEGTSPPALLLASPQAPDTTAPTVPGNLTATALAGNRVNLAWSAASDTVAVTRYVITRNGAYLTALAGSLTAYADSAVGGGLPYTYAVSV